MRKEIEIGEEVTIEDAFSMNHECTGIVKEILPDNIYKVVFFDGTFSYHEFGDLII